MLSTEIGQVVKDSMLKCLGRRTLELSQSCRALYEVGINEKCMLGYEVKGSHRNVEL